MLTGDKLASLLKRVVERKEDDRITLGLRKNGQPVHGRSFKEYTAHVLKHLETEKEPEVTLNEFGNTIKCAVRIENSYYDLMIASWR